MGTNLNQYGGEEKYFEAVRTFTCTIPHRMTRPWLWNPLYYYITPSGRTAAQAIKVLHDFTTKVIKDRKEKLLEDDDSQSEHIATRLPKRGLVFLDMLIAAQKEGVPISDSHIREEVDTFMFEGHETTAMAISWTIFLLGNHPDVQERVRSEVLSVESSWQNVCGLVYLEMIIKESLRMYPPVYYISRKAETLAQICDKKFPPGTALDLHIYQLHRDPAHFPDPDRFDPERFHPDSEQARKRHPFAYVPFSGGLRNCIGKRYAMMEVKIILASILRRFSLRSKHKPEEVHVVTDVVLRAQEGIQVYLTPLKE